MIMLVILVVGLLLPQNLSNPVEGATHSDYNHESFWYYPWGKSVTHKGVDIFANTGTELHPATYGWVLYCGEISMGGKVVLMLGPKWRLHYYAHLNEIRTHSLAFKGKKGVIGTVGTSGNAAGKSPHLHYSIVTLIPYPWRIDTGPQGWKKMFYLNPIPFLND